ncbi:acyltransferase family protein, partial [Staphylococcus aureus]
RQTWSLVAEVGFYAVLPLLAPWVMRGELSVRLRRLVVVASLGVGWIVLVATGVVSAPWASTWLPGHLVWFAVGMGIAAVEPRVRRRGAAALTDAPG